MLHMKTIIFLAFVFSIVTLSGRVKHSEVKMFLKRQPDVIRKYKSITTVMNSTLTLSENHLVFARKYYSDKFYPM